MTPKRIVVLGGGFGGVYAARHLEKMFAGGRPLEVTLVSRDNFFLFTPMLHEVAASDLDITHIVSPLRTLLKPTQASLSATSTRSTSRRRSSRCRTASSGTRTSSSTTTWSIALGSTTNFYGLPGLESERADDEDRSATRSTCATASSRRSKRRDTECAGADDDGLLTFVVAGGGFAGVETIAALNDFVREALAFYPRLHAPSASGWCSSTPARRSCPSSARRTRRATPAAKLTRARHSRF